MDSSPPAKDRDDLGMGAIDKEKREKGEGKKRGEIFFAPLYACRNKEVGDDFLSDGGNDRRGGELNPV